jgi:hypothetical protein
MIRKRKYRLLKLGAKRVDWKYEPGSDAVVTFFGQQILHNTKLPNTVPLREVYDVTLTVGR